MNFKILIFADDPDLAAELLLALEGAGPFSAYPVRSDGSGDEMNVPAGDAAVIVPGKCATTTESLLARLTEKNMPVIFLGTIASRSVQSLAKIRSAKDYSSLIGELNLLCGTGMPRAAFSQGGGHMPGVQDMTVEKP